MKRFTALAMALAALGCSPAPQPDAAPLQKRVTFSVLEDYDKGQDLAEVARDFDLFLDLGVTTWRGSFGWDDYEPAAGVYDFDWLHRFATLAAERGITLRPYLGYTPAWAASGGSDSEVWNDPPRDLEAWSRFVRTLAAGMRQHRNIVSYEIYNEENVTQWWDGTPGAYRELLRRGAEAVAAGNPDAQLLLGGMVYPDTEWIEAVCEGSEIDSLVDVIPFHAYPETWTPAHVTVENYLARSFESDFAAAADAACGRKPVWINETGYATTPGRSEADQAHWWARAIATFAAQPRIEHIGIYEIKDAPRDKPVIGDAPNYYLGLAYSDRRRKVAFQTVKWLVAMLGSQPFAWTEPAATLPSSRVHRHLFTRGDGRQLLFVWSRESAVVDVRLPGPARGAVEYGIDGRVSGNVEVNGNEIRRLTLDPGIVRIFEIRR
jgi:hypothetical protein